MQIRPIYFFIGNQASVSELGNYYGIFCFTHPKFGKLYLMTKQIFWR